MSGHVPVLRTEAINELHVEPGQKIIDATFGGGGYAAELLELGASVIAFDRDPTAIAAGHDRFKEAGDALTLIERPFDQMETALTDMGVSSVDGIVFDFGVSSMQLDRAERGFSFMADGPLDMRMGDGSPVSEFINQADGKDIADVIYQYGEERRARHLANLIVAARDEQPFETTKQLADLAEKALGKTGKSHPATRMFQALRIFVNDEFGQIIRALISSEKLLRPGGRLAVVTFHSLEDRIAKRFFAAATGKGEGASRHLPVVQGPAPTFGAATKAIRPSNEEVGENPRARSATLRAATRTEAPNLSWDDHQLSQLGIPPLVFSSLQQSWSSSS